MLKAVTFDLWQTLISETPDGSRWTKAERIRRIEAVLRTHQIPVTKEEIAGAYETQRERLEELWETHKDIGARAHVELLLEILQVERSAQYSTLLFDPLIDAYTLPILSALPVLIEGATGVLNALAARGLGLAVICNTGRTPGNILRIIIERLGIAQMLSVQIFSDELGLRKPRPEIFARALAVLGVEPRQAVHIGDSLESDIGGARAIGMHAVHLCHVQGASPHPGEGETIFSLSELLPLIDSLLERV